MPLSIRMKQLMLLIIIMQSLPHSFPACSGEIVLYQTISPIEIECHIIPGLWFDRIFQVIRPKIQIMIYHVYPY